MTGLLVDVNDPLRLRERVGSATEVLDVGDQLSQLGGQDVNDVEILSPGLPKGGVGIQEVDVGIYCSECW
jgi:hypothetical protein